jgi:hypothetical protein
MRHQNSVMHGLLKHIPWSVFDNLVYEHRADARVRQWSTKSQFVSLLYAQPWSFFGDDVRHCILRPPIDLSVVGKTSRLL